ncbi:hypothetical protein BCS96_10260 [Vibrio breoganii]|uniref:hypothetical protein n=1 Tax=Vibrio breoganii TaxID=553239 RepID=UPI000C8275D3|nr:hypothetical protein [Vibrio breoganii]PMO99174.1 hypothetical protein BCS96_10260 [Vibrio breoganii]
MKLLSLDLEKLVFKTLVYSSILVFTKLMPVSPIYPIYVVCILVFYSILRKASSEFVNVIVILNYMTVFAVVVQFYKSDASALVNLIFSLQALSIMLSLSYRFTEKELINVAISYCYLCTFLISIDSLYRLSHPIVPTESQLAAYERRNTVFYLYKYNSLMFGSSNTTALVALSNFFLLLFISDRTNKNYFLLKIVLLAVLFFTFSRAAIASAIIALLLLYSFRIGFIAVALGSVFALNIGMLVYHTTEDLSLKSKFHIITEVLSYYQNNFSLELLLTGVGLSRSPELIGISAHNIFISYGFELGLVGIGLLLFLILTSIRLSRLHAVYLWYPILISGLSYFIYAGAPFFFVPLALIVIISSKRTTFFTGRFYKNY